jgi:DNA-directed RNA polymerase subunit M/transcription elongation factor TFIIS
MERFCQKCGRIIASDEARFCSQCGHSLHIHDEQGSNKQVFDNFRDVQSVNAVQNSDVRDSFNTIQRYDPFYRPSLDIRSSLVTKMPTVKRLLQVGIGVLTITSGILTIVGKNIFQVKTYFPDVLIKAAWIYGIPLVAVSITLLIFLFVLKITGGFSLCRQDWLIVGQNVVNVEYRCACPYSECGGIMEVKSIGNIWRWVCRKNPTMHQVDYDSTLVSKAVEKGQLNSKFQNVR